MGEPLSPRTVAPSTADSGAGGRKAFGNNALGGDTARQDAAGNTAHGREALAASFVPDAVPSSLPDAVSSPSPDVAASSALFTPASPASGDSASASCESPSNARAAGQGSESPRGGSVRGAFIRLHLSVILAGFTGVLGKLITMSEGLLVWYRFALTIVLLGGIALLRGGVPRVPRAEAMRLMSAGVLLCLHWLFFYGSIKASNVSVGVVCFALVGFFTAVVEPWWTHNRLSLRELLLGALTVLGIGCIFSFDARYRLGIGLGVVSSLFAALYTVCNKLVSSGHGARESLLYQMVGGFTTMCCVLPLYIWYFDISYIIPSMQDALGLICLSLFCTVGMMTLVIQALRQISAFTVSLSYNLEPVYSIIIAMLFMGESKEVGLPFAIGLALIAFSVFIQSFVAWKEQQYINVNIGKNSV